MKFETNRHYVLNGVQMALLICYINDADSEGARMLLEGVIEKQGGKVEESIETTGKGGDKR
jgi:hypothetical protein